MSIEASHHQFCANFPPPPPLFNPSGTSLSASLFSALPGRGRGNGACFNFASVTCRCIHPRYLEVMSSIPGEFRCFLYSTLLTTELTSFLSDFISRSFKQVQGLGTALKILFSGHELDDGKLDKSSHFHLKRTEIVSLFNAFGR